MNRLGFPELVQGQAGKEWYHNEALFKIAVLVQASVRDNAWTWPPADPAPGETHIVPADVNPESPWAGHAADLACWDSDFGVWRFLAPPRMCLAYVEAKGTLYRFDGAAWAPFRASVDGDGLMSKEDKAALAELLAGGGGTGGAVTSVAGRTGAVVLALADVGGLSAALAGKAAAAHAAAHASGGSDALVPAAIGAAAASHVHAQADVAGLAPLAKLTAPVQSSSVVAAGNLASVPVSGLAPGDALAIEALYDGSVEASYKRTQLAIRKADGALQSLARIDFTGASNSGVMYQSRLLCLTDSTFVFFPYPVATGQIAAYVSTPQPFTLEFNGWVDASTSWLRLLWARVTRL